jgi:hypothetical protein
MQSSIPSDFDQRYQFHLKHLKLKGLQPKTIDAYARAIRRMGVSVQPPHLDAPDVPWQSKRFNKATGLIGDGVYKG